MPQYLYEAIGGDRKICITQPRRVAAISLAERVSQEMGRPKIGELVGYRVRFEEKLDKDLTKIVFMTDGMLLREALLDKLLSSYSVLILDEVHERSVNSDVLLALVKEIALQRKGDLKLVVMSATLDSSKFAQYFGQGVAQVDVEGRTYPIEVYHSLSPHSDFIVSKHSVYLTFFY